MGPVRSQAAEVIEMIGDRKRFGVLIVTIPEETPVQEALDTMHALEQRTSAHITGVVVNQSVVISELTRSACAVVQRHATTHTTGLAQDAGYLVAVADRQLAEIDVLTTQRRIPTVHVGLTPSNDLTTILESISLDLVQGIDQW
jgi:hypothetical protein